MSFFTDSFPMGLALPLGFVLLVGIIAGRAFWCSVELGLRILRDATVRV